MQLYTIPGDRVPGITSSNAYLVCAAGSADCAVIDPSDAAAALALLQERRLACSHILLTHGHYDHILGVAELKAATGALVCIHAADAAMLSSNRKSLSFLWMKQLSPVAPDRLLRDGEEVAAGGLYFSVLHTPGHTPGSVIYRVEGEMAAFSGDTIFYGDVGATHFPGSDFSALKQSVRRALRELLPECALYPGHGPATTAGHEAAYGPLR